MKMIIFFTSERGVSEEGCSNYEGLMGGCVNLKEQGRGAVSVPKS